MAAPMVDHNPSFTFQHSSPLDTLAHRSSSRRAKGAKLLAPEPAAPVSSQKSYSTYLSNVTTPPRQQEHYQMSPSSPLLHTQFRTSAVSYDAHNSFLDTSMSCVGNESQDEYDYKDDDASVYSRPSMLPSEHSNPQDRHSPDPNSVIGSWEDAYAGTADLGPPSSQNQNGALASHGVGLTESPLPSVVISIADAPIPVLEPTRGTKMPIAAPTKFNFSRPGRPPTLPPEDLKRRVLERNAGRHPPHQQSLPSVPLPSNSTRTYPSETVMSGSSQPRMPYPPESSLNVNRYTPSSSLTPNQPTRLPQHYPHHPVSYSEYSDGASQKTDPHVPYQSPQPGPSRASLLHLEAAHSSSVVPSGHSQETRPLGSINSYDQIIDTTYRHSHESLSPSPPGSLELGRSENNQLGRVRGYESPYQSDVKTSGVGEAMGTNKGKHTRPAGPQEVSSSSHSMPSPSPTLSHDFPNTDGSPLADYSNYFTPSSKTTSGPSTPAVTSTTLRPTVELLRGPPPRAVSPAASVYSQYSFYQLDSKSPSPNGSTSRLSPDSAGFHGLSDQTRPTLLSPNYTPPTRSPVSASRSPSPASTISPAAPIVPHTPQEYLQLGIQHHEANRLKDSAICFEKSAKESGGCGVGMVMWGLTLRHGWGCEKNEKLGFKWLQKAAESAVVDLEKSRKGLEANAVRDELVIAIYEVGQCFFQGWGVRKDLEMAVSYYTVAARLGDADAQQDLGFCLANGKGCKKDRKEAARWYRAAIAQGASDVGMAWVYKDKFR